MIRREIPSSQWPESVDQFARAHRGKLVRIELIDSGGTKHRYSDDQPFLGIVDERRGQSDESFTVMWGAQSPGAFSHTIHRPIRIWMAEWNDGFSGKLEIESGEGTRLVVQAGPEEQMLPPGVVMDGILLENDHGTRN